MMEQNIRPAESTHWYTLDGIPCYTVMGKNGQERATNLTDARKLGLLPSVTTIMSEAYKPGLEIWKQKQVLLAALTLPRLEEETEQDYVNRIIDDSQEQAKKAAERGTQIHAWIQQGFEGRELEGEALAYYDKAIDTIGNETGAYFFECETPFATPRYGGKIDLHKREDGLVIDIKTKEELNDKTTTFYDDHCTQLSAYREGLKLPQAKCGILFVATSKIEAKLVWIPEEKLQRGWNMFQALLDYYYAKTGL